MPSLARHLTPGRTIVDPGGIQSRRVGDLPPLRMFSITRPLPWTAGEDGLLTARPSSVGWRSAKDGAPPTSVPPAGAAPRQKYRAVSRRPGHRRVHRPFGCPPRLPHPAARGDKAAAKGFAKCAATPRNRQRLVLSGCPIGGRRSRGRTAGELWGRCERGPHRQRGLGRTRA